jgi:hypothetical protein
VAFTVGSTPFGIFDSDAQFASDADRIVDFTRRKLGDPVMCVHMSSSQIYAAFEEACLEYSAIINQYQAKSVLTQFLGAPTGSLSGSENTYPARLLEFQKKMAEPYGEEANVGGSHPVYSGSIDLQEGVQKYDLQTLLSGTHPAMTGSSVNARIRLRRVFHYSPLQAYRFFGTTSAVNYLHGQFGFESFTPETIFYLLPIWEDVLRGMQFETSNRIRRSNYSYESRNNELVLYPIPTQNMKLHFEFTLPPNPTVSANEQEASSRVGVANLSNIPFGNIQYSRLNSIGKQWIRRMAFSLAKETEGQIRAKMHTIPIPNGDLTLNGPELISDARAEIEVLRTELRDILEELTYDKLAAREAEMAEQLRRTIAEIPLGIYIG